MNEKRVAHLLACIGEECGEVQQMVGKSLRFGVYDTSPKTGKENLAELVEEFKDVYTVFNMLMDELGIKREQRSQLFSNSKRDKVEKYIRRYNVGT